MTSFYMKWNTGLKWIKSFAIILHLFVNSLRSYNLVFGVLTKDLSKSQSVQLKYSSVINAGHGIFELHIDNASRKSFPYNGAAAQCLSFASAIYDKRFWRCCSHLVRNFSLKTKIMMKFDGF